MADRSYRVRRVHGPFPIKRLPELGLCQQIDGPRADYVAAIRPDNFGHQPARHVTRSATAGFLVRLQVGPKDDRIWPSLASPSDY